MDGWRPTRRLSTCAAARQPRPGTSTFSRASSKRKYTRRSRAISWPSPSSTTCMLPTPISNVGGNTAVSQLRARPIKFPIPMVPRAVQPKARDDEAKISAGLAKIADEDPTFSIRRDTQTHELVISGMSDLHLDVIQQRLKNRHKVEMNTHVPHVPYLETILGEADANHRHKKQTGGRGQFGEVHLRVRPRERGEGFNFRQRGEGGHDPQSVHPGGRKGCSRADGQRGDLGPPGGGRRGRGLFRQGPSGRQFRASVQDGRGDGVSQGV